jgi:CubicO group peptidase (beta-lactamase class C family)
MPKLAFFVTLMLAVTSGNGTNPAPIFPGMAWAKASPTEMGWSTERLEEAKKFYDTLPPASLVVIDRGKSVVEWGDPATKIKVSSMRKSILSALYGIDSANGRLDLDKTLEQVGIDDDPPLTQDEKKATVRMLIQARSGIYHSYVAGTPSMRESQPPRGSHAPGTFWFYNNWDFNALGTIFEQQFHRTIGTEFRDKIARPT